MRSTLVPLLVAALLAFAALPAVEAQGQKSPTAEESSGRGQERAEEERAEESEDAREDAEKDAERDEDDGEERGRGRSDEAPPRATPIPMGEFSVDATAGSARGEYVSFHYNDTGLQGFTVQGISLFDLSLLRGRLALEEAPRVQGSKLRVEGQDFELVVHDNPGAVTRIESDDPVALDFPADARIVRGNDDRKFTIHVGNVSGTIRGEGLQLNGTRLVSEGDLLVVLDSARAAVDEHRPEIVRAIGEGHVGAEASIVKVGDELAQEVVSYGNVTMTTMKAERGNLTVLIDGHGFDGRVLVLNVDSRVVGAANKDDLNILFDNVTIQNATSLQDILNPDDDGLMPEYYVVFDPELEAFQLIVSVPHYSVHTLSVTLVELLPPPPVVIGIVAGVLLLVPSAYALFRRPKQG